MDNVNPPIFDGHVDVLSNLNKCEPMRPVQAFQNGYRGHIDIPKAKAGGFAGGLFALYVPSSKAPIVDMDKPKGSEAYEVALPTLIEQKDALPVIMSQFALLKRLEKAGLVKTCTNVEGIRTCMDAGTMAVVVHMEGAEAIDEDFHALELFYGAGLRSIGPVWSRPNIFGHGVPFKFPSTGDIGPGLTDLGKELIAQCNGAKIMVDLSHLNEQGFWDVAKISNAPLIATHSNCYGLSRSSRNLTDRQLDAIAESDGMVGLNFAVGFVRPDGKWNTRTDLELVLSHLDYLIDRLGEDRVGIGSDFDGAQVPKKIGSAAGLPVLRQAMKNHGYNEKLMVKLCHQNWLRALERTWSA